MTESVKSYERVEGLKDVILSLTITGSGSPEDAIAALDRLERLGIESFVTEEGDLWIRSWTIAAEDFVSPEHAAVIRSKRSFPGQTDKLEWLSKNLQEIRRQYGNQWVAVYGEAIVAAAANLSDLITQIAEYDGPLVTFIPADPVLWSFTYANQEF
jgi:hypothetical protein